MSPLIPILRHTIGPETVQAVNARDLHAFLEVGTAFKDWITRRVEDFGFLEGSDFCSFLSESTGGRPAREYMLSLSMAKELAMVERNDRGKQARLYFIECERQAQDPLHRLLTMSRPEMLEMAAGLAREKQALSAQVAELAPKAAFADQVGRAVDTHTMAEAAKILNTGRTRLFDFLRIKGYLFQDSRNWLPYQSYLDAGLFRVAERHFEDAVGRDRIYAKVLVTGKGLVHLQAKLGEARA